MRPDRQTDESATATTPAAGRAAYVETYGCQMNVADSELVTAILADAGYRIVEAPQQADVVLINTCAVRANAEQRVVGRASQLSGLREANPELTLGILGCAARSLVDDLAERAPFVDLVVGPDSYQHLPELLAQTRDELRLDVRLDRTENYQGIDPRRDPGANAWITIIRGCDRFCSYCIVPFVRGRERSLDSAEILRQVHEVAEAGYHEITLLGQTVNSYRHEGVDFAGLLSAVAAVHGIERVRFMSPHPGNFDARTIERMAAVPEICPSLHLPLQSGSDLQLDRMRRGYTATEYRDLVHRLRDAVPGLALATDIIVGFCGESPDDFARTVALMEEIRFHAAFMFRYSERHNTHAARQLTDDVPSEVKAERLEQVIELQERISLETNREQVGNTVEVLVEGKSRRPSDTGASTWYGRSPQGKVVVFPQRAEANHFVHAQVREATAHTLHADLVSP